FSMGLYPEPLVASKEMIHGNSRPVSKLKTDYEYHVSMCQYPWTNAPGIIKHDDHMGVIPCCYMPQELWNHAESRYRFGDVCGRSMTEIYNSSAYWQFREDLALGKTQDLCGNCSASKTHSPNLRQLGKDHSQQAFVIFGSEFDPAVRLVADILKLAGYSPSL